MKPLKNLSDPQTMSVDASLQVFESRNVRGGAPRRALRVHEAPAPVKKLVAALPLVDRIRLLGELLEDLPRHEQLRLADQIRKPRRRRSS